jgi:hypothetical protein
MRNELKIVHDATDMLMRDGLELERKFREMTEANEYLTDKLKKTEDAFCDHKCNSSNKIDDMNSHYTKKIKELKEFAIVECNVSSKI